MDRCDALIVGGGPAGSTCARELVRQGLDVVVLDQARFPRDKTCAGWITPQVVESLQLDLADYARHGTLQPLTGFDCGVLGGPLTTVRYPDAVSFGIRRSEFDHYLLQRCGARLALETPFANAVRQAGQWIVNEHWQTPLLIGAAGHFCPVAKLLGADVGRGEQAFVARETEFPMDRALALNSRVSATRGELLFCDDLAGYGWCLRKGNYLNVGLGRDTTTGLGDDLQRLLRWLVSTQRVPLQQWPRFRGHAYLAYNRSRRPLVADGCLLVGDAAGMACERSGEGIRPAVESALLAAVAVGEARGDYRATGLASYIALVEARFGPRQHHPLPTVGLPRAPRWRRAAGRWLVSTEPFLRHVVLDRFFLQRAASALHPAAGTLKPENFS